MCLPGETAVLCSPENKLKNIDFTLRGYDIYKGNPLVATSDVSHTDPGLRRQIFDVDYSKLTPDRRYCIPDGLEVSVCDGCKFSWSTHVISGVKSYTDKLGLHVGVEGGTPNASFGASADYKKVDEPTSEHESVYTTSDISCCAYKIEVQQYHQHKYVPNFLSALETLPEEYKNREDKKAYLRYVH